jgi:hypothetical protein
MGIVDGGTPSAAAVGERKVGLCLTFRKPKNKNKVFIFGLV